MSTIVQQIQRDLREQGDPVRAKSTAHFFKLEPGDKDEFLGTTVPKQRVISKQYFRELSPKEVVELLHSPIHDDRLTALFIWVLQYQKGDMVIRREIYQLYLKNTKWINNWDLVDSSAGHIVGDYIFDKNRTVLTKLSKSKNVWERRIAVLAAGEFIKHGEFGWTLKLAEQNLRDPHHYIHKATGWMLREVGERDQAVLLSFLEAHAAVMPRTALRYAIEHLDAAQKKHFMTLKLAK